MIGGPSLVMIWGTSTASSWHRPLQCLLSGPTAAVTCRRAIRYMCLVGYISSSISLIHSSRFLFHYLALILRAACRTLRPTLNPVKYLAVFRESTYGGRNEGIRCRSYKVENPICEY